MISPLFSYFIVYVLTTNLIGRPSFRSVQSDLSMYRIIPLSNVNTR